MTNDRKQLSVENWLEVDPILDLFVTTPHDGGPARPRTPDERVKGFLAVELGAQVPDDVRNIFLAGQAAMIYGHFYYPLFTLGAHHLFAALEAALTHRCQLAGEAKPPRGMAKKIVWLREQGIISGEQRTRLDLDRQMRNDAAHPRFQSLMPPAHTFMILRGVAGDIDALFALPAQGGGAC